MYAGCGQGVDVGCGYSSAHELFGGHVAAGADDGGASDFVVGDGLDGAEIDEVKAVVFVAEDVGWFDVTVDYGRAEAVEIGEDVEHLCEEIACLVFVEGWGFGEQGCEAFAWDVVLGGEQSCAVVEVEGVDVGGDCGVIEVA